MDRPYDLEQKILTNPRHQEDKHRLRQFCYNVLSGIFIEVLFAYGKKLARKLVHFGLGRF